MSLLDSASDIRCYGEVFKKHTVEVPIHELQRFDLTRSDTLARDAAPLQFLENLFAANPEKAVGFKAFPAHLKNAAIEQLPELADWKIVYLTRNPIESYVSGVRAEQTGVYTSLDGAPRPKSVLSIPVVIDTKKMIARIKWVLKMYDKWEQNEKKWGGDRVTIIDYSELSSDERMLELLTFLGSKETPLNLRSNRLKQFTRPLSEGIVNFEEVVEALDNHRLLSLLPE